MATMFSSNGLHQRAREALLASNWWAAAIRGVVAILIGAMAVLSPAVTLLALVMIFAAYSFVDGVFAIVLAIRGARRHERWGWLAFSGIISIGAAVVAVLYPAITALAFAILLGVWALISGTASLIAGIQLGKAHGRWWLVLAGLISIFVAVWILLNPLLGMIALSYVFGFQALLLGFAQLALAYRLRERSVDLRADDTLDRAAPAGAREAHHHG
jgi:uncharacterized membrane protein HdeD (DUF308 family)